MFSVLSEQQSCFIPLLLNHVLKKDLVRRVAGYSVEDEMRDNAGQGLKFLLSSQIPSGLSKLSLGTLRWLEGMSFPWEKKQANKTIHIFLHWFQHTAIP